MFLNKKTQHYTVIAVFCCEFVYNL